MNQSDNNCETNSEVYNLVSSVIDHVKSSNVNEKEIIDQITKMVKTQLQMSNNENIDQKDKNIQTNNRPLQLSDLQKTSQKVDQTTSPTRVSLKSSAIIRAVLNSFEDEEEIELEEEVKEEKSTMIPKVLNEELPLFSLETLEKKIDYYKNILSNEPYIMTLQSVIELKNILIETKKLKLSYDENLDHFFQLCAKFLISNFKEYKSIEVSLLKEFIEASCYLENYSKETIPPLIKILKNPLYHTLYESIIQSLFMMGQYGIEALVDAASQSCSEWDSYILTHLANHPLVQEFVIVNSLIRECEKKDLKSKTKAVSALSKMGIRAVSALPVLLNMLISGSVDRSIIVKAIRCCGDEGEKLLIFVLSHNPNPRVRAMAAFGLGLKCNTTPRLRVIVNTDFATSFAAPPRVVLMYPDSEDEHLLFDARELITNIRRGLGEGVYDEIIDPKQAIQPGLTEFLICQLDKYKHSENFDTSISMSFNNESILPMDQSLSEIRAVVIKKKLLASKFGKKKKTEEEEEEEEEFYVASPNVVDALATALMDQDENVKMVAAGSIGSIGMPSALNAVPSLCNALKDKSNKVRAACVDAIGKLGQDVAQDTIQYLIPLLKDSHWNVRYSTLLALKAFGEKSAPAVPYLEKILLDGTLNRNEVSECLMAIGAKGSEILINILLKQSKFSRHIRVSAAYGLSFADVTDPFIDRIVETLYFSSRDKVPQVRVAVIQSLGILAHKAKESLTYLRKRSFLPFLYGFLRDSCKNVRQTAARVLANTGPHGEKLLIEALLKDSIPLIRASAAYGLKFVGPQTIRTLLLALNDKDSSVIKEATSTIEEIGIDAIVEALNQRPAQHIQSVICCAQEIVSSTYPYHSKELKDLLKMLIQRLEAIPS